MESQELHSPDRQPSRIQLYLTSVSQVDPIKTFFPITEHEYLIAQSKTKATSSKHTSVFFGNSLQLILTDGSIYPQKGKSC